MKLSQRSGGEPLEVLDETMPHRCTEAWRDFEALDDVDGFLQKLVHCPLRNRGFPYDIASKASHQRSYTGFVHIPDGFVLHLPGIYRVAKRTGDSEKWFQNLGEEFTSSHRIGDDGLAIGATVGAWRWTRFQDTALPERLEVDQRWDHEHALVREGLEHFGELCGDPGVEARRKDGLVAGDRSVVRASAGIFYDNDMRHNLEFATNPPFFLVRQFPFPPSLSDPFPEALGSTALQPATLDKKYRDTYVAQWNLGVQHEVLRGLLTEVAYVGNHSVKARRLRNVNQLINNVPPYPGFGPILLFEQAGSSNYNALQIRAERRFSQAFGFTSSYTWGHAIDDRPGQGAGRIPNNYNLRVERGNADFDVRHNWTSSVSVNLPWGSNRFWGRWSLNAIGIVQSGRPFTVTTQAITGDRPNVVPGVDWRPTDQGPDAWINPAAFSIPAANTFGNLGRNTLWGPPLRTLDVSLVKTEAIQDARLEFRAEFFNIFNHPNFGLPNSSIGPTLGLISSTSVPERQIQFGVKLTF